jgi:hypothetical protein
LKSRLSLIFTALVLILGCMVWVVRDRGATGDVAIVPMPPMQVQVLPPAPLQSSSLPPVVSSTLPPAAMAAVAPAVPTEVTVTPAIPAEVTPEVKSAPLVHVTTDGNVAYTARDGDTVSNLAVALRGSDSKANRDAVIAADNSLQANPNRVLTGQTYSVEPAAPVAPVAQAAADAPAATADATVDAKPDSQRSMKYTAQAGDSVAVLASSLLGGDTKANREAVIGDNASLQTDPDHLVAGKTYNITTTSGLAADPNARQKSVPTTQRDADEAARMSVGRVLRYTAQPGDTVSKLATVLLGSDTQANRDAIIQNNRSLKQDPDHLVAGQTYWISAPTATSAVVPVADTDTP